jgi:hypothetical protein
VTDEKKRAMPAFFVYNCFTALLHKRQLYGRFRLKNLIVDLKKKVPETPARLSMRPKSCSDGS